MNSTYARKPSRFSVATTEVSRAQAASSPLLTRTRRDKSDFGSCAIQRVCPRRVLRQRRTSPASGSVLHLTRGADRGASLPATRCVGLTVDLGVVGRVLAPAHVLEVKGHG